MRTIIENLLTLQKLILQSGPLKPEQRARMDDLRKQVPAPILAHFDRMVSRGRNGAAVVRHGMCGECHIRIPTGTLASLVTPHDVYLCETCACYLLLPLDEAQAAVSQPTPRPVARSVRAKSTVVTSTEAAPQPSLI